MIDKLVRTFFCMLVLSALALASACGPNEVQVGRTESGGTILLQAGDVLVVTLPSNPSTGYSWQVLAVDPAVLVQQGDPVYQPSADGTGLVGTGGTETFRFDAISGGSVTLTLGYLRPWEQGSQPIEIFSVDVVVSG